MALETTVEQVEARVPLTVIALVGELDASNFEALIQTAREQYDGGARNLLLDLTDLTFMASSGLVALHSIVRIMHGEAPPDPEAGWSALHATAGSGSPARGPAVRAAARGRARPRPDRARPPVRRASRPLERDRGGLTAPVRRTAMDHVHPLDDAGLDAPARARSRRWRRASSVSIEDDHGTPMATSGRATARPPDALDARPGVSADHRVAMSATVIGRRRRPGPATDDAPLLAATGAGRRRGPGRPLASNIARERHDASPAASQRIEQELASRSRAAAQLRVAGRARSTPGYDIASHYEAAREVGGDFFELFRLRRRGRPLSIAIADVTGKGIAAALLMAFSRPLMHAAIDQMTGPAQALERINRILVEERRSSLFITALVARLDLAGGHLRLANAGHEPPIFVPADGGPPRLVARARARSSAPSRRSTCPRCAPGLLPGDLLVLYTDGVTDARSPIG